MAILHIQWWPFSRVERGGGCSLIDSVWCDIGKDLFALSTVLVIMRLSGTHSSLPKLMIMEWRGHYCFESQICPGQDSIGNIGALIWLMSTYPAK